MESSSQLLDFTDCLLDSPYHHERQSLEEQNVIDTRKSVSSIIERCRHLVDCTKELSKAYLSFAQSLVPFQNDCPEIRDIVDLIRKVETERENLPKQFEDAFIEPLSRAFLHFDLVQQKRELDTATSTFQSLQNTYMSRENQPSIRFEQHAFIQMSIQHSHHLKLMETFKRYEIIDALVCLMNHQMNFHHLGFEHIQSSRKFTDLNNNLKTIHHSAIQKATEAETNKEIVLSSPIELLRTSLHLSSIMTGYLSVMKKSIVTTAWIKCFWEYDKISRAMRVRPSLGVSHVFPRLEPDKFDCLSATVIDCSTVDNSMYESLRRPFCMKVTFDCSGEEVTSILQANDEDEWLLWLQALGYERATSMDYAMSRENSFMNLTLQGHDFLKMCFEAIERDALDTEGLYRIPGSKSKSVEFLHSALSGVISSGDLHLSNLDDVHAVTSAVLTYIGNLSEPVTTFARYENFIYAASLENANQQIRSIHLLVHRLPPENFKMLKMLISHLAKVASRSEFNKMTAANLGVCFGPALLRSRQDLAEVESVKLGNHAVVILVEHYNQIFSTKPFVADIPALCQRWRIASRSGQHTPQQPRRGFFLAALLARLMPRIGEHSTMKPQESEVKAPVDQNVASLPIPTTNFEENCSAITDKETISSEPQSHHSNDDSFLLDDNPRDEDAARIDPESLTNFVKDSSNLFGTEPLENEEEIYHSLDQKSSISESSRRNPFLDDFIGSNAFAGSSNPIIAEGNSAPDGEPLVAAQQTGSNKPASNPFSVSNLSEVIGEGHKSSSAENMSFAISDVGTLIDDLFMLEPASPSEPHVDDNEPSAIENAPSGETKIQVEYNDDTILDLH